MKTLSLIVAALLVTGCATTGQKKQQSAINQKNAKELLLPGTPQSKVLEAFGSPNTLSTDESKREVWGYLKDASQHDGSGIGGSLYQGGLAYFTGGWVNMDGSSSSRSTQSSTLIVYFDKNKKVRHYTFRSEVF